MYFIGAGATFFGCIVYSAYKGWFSVDDFDFSLMILCVLVSMLLSLVWPATILLAAGYAIGALIKLISEK